jgi:N-methylhydantoinase A
VQRRGRFDLEQIATLLAGLTRDAGAWLATEGVPEASRRLSWHASLRYEDQGSELTLPWAGTAADQAGLDATLTAFHAEHERLYSFRLDDVPVELVTLRVDAVGLLPALHLREIASGGSAEAAITQRQRIALASGMVEAPVYDRAKLGAGLELRGPCVITQLDATTLLLPGQVAAVHPSGAMVVREG